MISEEGKKEKEEEGGGGGGGGVSDGTRSSVVSKVCICGAGAFGFALAKIIGDNAPHARLVMFDTFHEYVDSISKDRKHPVFHKVSFNLSERKKEEKEEKVIVIVIDDDDQCAPQSHTLSD